ncbi:patatin-like phospholipase family protein [Clostridium sp. 1001271st1 H5]|uniref:patatin-like phospholipase family protein n=1 Tax=unclassified Clostridium TaxID=2614128 RepID=UPI001105E192|nr:patatin-like phospholipase family protein [Clostridium sp. 1001271st1 H5]
MDIIKLQLDLSKEYGIVLEGGGAKGAYQIGAWRALREAGIRIKGAAGTSVGALNGALICMDDFEKAERIWENISYSRVMDVDDELMDRLRKFSLKNISSLASLNVGELITGAIRVLRDGGFDIAPLRALIDDVVDEEKIRNSDRELYVVTYSISDRHPLIANVKEAPEGGMADLLMASAYLIGFRQERLGGKYYMDGGGINNVPVDVLLDRGYKDVIVLRIYGYGVDTEKKLEVPEGVTLYHVAPRRDLGGLLEFDRRRARRNMLLGYFDGKRMLYGLAGRVYYIDAPEGEPYYFDKMMSEMQTLLSYMEQERKDEGETKNGREIPMQAPLTQAPLDQAVLSRESIPAYPGYRIFTEQIFPRLAKELKLKEGWDYKDLYLSILEDLAKQYRISRFKIYTVEELLRLIHKKAGTAALKAMIPVLDSGTQV